MNIDQRLVTPLKYKSNRDVKSRESEERRLKKMSLQ